ncbi:MAG: phosphate ABC transporter permease PstA [Candidatus Nanopelagicales bacterium]
MSTTDIPRADLLEVALGSAPADEPRTTVVNHDFSQPPADKRPIAKVRLSDVLQLAGSIIGALSLTAVIFAFLAPFDGIVGFVLIAYPIFLGLYALVVWQDEDATAVVDRLVAAVVTSLAMVLVGALFWVVGYVVVNAVEALKHLNLFTEDMSNTGPLDPLDSGGILHAIVGSVIMITIALLIVIPLGVTTAVFMNELPNRFSRFVRIIVEAMTALPSIIAGLFIYATFILLLGLPKSGLAAALAISVMMLPIIIRASDVVLRLVPGNLKEASYAMGASQIRTVWHVTLPTARSGLMTAIILGTARGVGETSPVLLTAGFTQSLNVNPLDGPMISLPLAAFKFIGSSEATFKWRGFAAATVLLGLVLILFIVARIVGGRGPGQLSNRQRRRAAAQSRRDYERMVDDEASAVSPDRAAAPAMSSPASPPEGDPTS